MAGKGKRIRKGVTGSSASAARPKSKSAWWFLSVAFLVACFAIGVHQWMPVKPPDEPFAPAGPDQGALMRKSGFSEADLADVLELEKLVWSDSANPHLSNQTRVFGKTTPGRSSQGHLATYMHAHVGTDPRFGRLQAKLLQISLELEKEAGWNIGNTELFKTLRPRSFESIRYDSDAGGSNGDHAVEIGWHSDFMSVLTVSVMLTNRGDYSGGAFQTRRVGGDIQNNEPGRGDVVLWKSWDRHRVDVVTSGHRHVLVCQWWLAPAHTSLLSGPASAHYFQDGPDLLLPYCEAITTVDPKSFHAQRICGKKIAALAMNNRRNPADALRLNRLAMGYHKRASRIADGTSEQRVPLLSMAQTLGMITLAPQQRPVPEDLRPILELCETVHTMGAAADEGRQDDLGNTVLRFLRMAITHESTQLGKIAQYTREFPFLELYWS